MLVNVLIYKVYLYDNNLIIIFNTQNKPYKEKIPLIEELEEKLGASSYKVRSAQPIKNSDFHEIESCYFFIMSNKFVSFYNFMINSYSIVYKIKCRPF